MILLTYDETHDACLIESSPVCTAIMHVENERPATGRRGEPTYTYISIQQYFMAWGYLLNPYAAAGG